ncbi:MAG: winged helix-turn-helix domain-containing protein [Nitrosopumilus sp.]|nr:winged helix-turn-helix domain-containing protein [Nitrosopumilus sp.]
MKLSQNENNIKRIDLSTIKIIILSIKENSSIRKTSLMVKTKITYPRLNLYLQWLIMMGFILDCNTHFTVTTEGLKFVNRLSKNY